ncbi:type II toxin-antitoxin system VapB family antitoxin [Paraburkholderia sp. NMBU_R16]|nr:type II toxin-antitoxin system VapB family antitoxin [Paraburkholderia sp. NMBU_R16]
MRTRLSRDIHHRAYQHRLDDALISDALAESGLKTMQEVVELGLQKIIQLKRQEELRRLRGSIDWQGVSTK